MNNNRNEKRRLQLTKRANKQSKKKSLAFAHPSDSTMFVNNNGTVAKTPISKRMLAIILAVVFILSVIPTAVFLNLRGKAADTDLNMLESVSLNIIVNGEASLKPIVIEPGVIADNIKEGKIDLGENELPEGVEFINAIMRDSSNPNLPIDTEVQSVAGYKGATYYSLNDESDFGTRLDSSSGKQRIYLVYANKNYITVNGSHYQRLEWNALRDSKGDYIYGSEDLEIKKIVLDEHYNLNKITYKSGTVSGTADVVDGSARIPASDIKGDITINLDISKIDGYKIIDKSLAQGLGNGGLAETRGTNQLTASTFNSYFRTRWAPETIRDDGTGNYKKTFYMYSNSSTGGSNFLLNMLRINGEEVEVSKINAEPIENHILSDGTKVSVRLVEPKAGMYWLDNRPNPGLFQSHDRDYNWDSNYKATTNRKERAIYEITLENVHSNVTVEYNFKQKANREIIIKGLKGITETAHAREKLGNGYTYEYFFESSDSNVYTAYYQQRRFIPSANLYLYRVKPGYNPYTVYENMELYYVDDDNNVVKQTGILSGDEKVGRPEEAIRDAKAGNAGDAQYIKYQSFNNEYRKWGGHSKQVVHIENEGNHYDGTENGILFHGNPFLLTSIGEDNDPVWYAIALSQNQANNQQLYLNANPYEYTIELDLQGGTLAESEGYTIADWLASSDDTYSVENPIAYLPTAEPQRSGYIFEGWQMQKKNDEGEYVDIDDVIKQRADQISITGNTLFEVGGNERVDQQTIRFKALWKRAKEATKTKIQKEIYIQSLTPTDIQHGGKYYTLVTPITTETQLAETPVVLLNQYAPDNATYYEMRTGKYEENGEEKKFTKLSTTSVKQDDADIIPEDNILRIHYDLKLRDLSVQKIVRGTPKTKSSFDITVTLTPNADSLVSLDDAINLITISNGESFTKQNGVLVYQTSYKKNDTITFSNIPYKWHYNVEEATSADDDFSVTYAPNASDELVNNTAVKVTNTGKNPGIATEKTLNPSVNNTYKINLGAWATGDSVSSLFDEATALDIAVVVDQSASMAAGDVGKVYAPIVDTYGDTVKNHSITNATGKYYLDPDDGQFYQVKSKTLTDKYVVIADNSGKTISKWTAQSARDWYINNNNKDLFFFENGDPESGDPEKIYASNTETWYRNVGDNVRIYGNFTYDATKLGNTWNLISARERDGGIDNSKEALWTYTFKENGEPFWHKIYSASVGSFLEGYYLTLYYYTNAESGSSISGGRFDTYSSSGYDTAVSNGTITLMGTGKEGYGWTWGGGNWTETASYYTHGDMYIPMTNSSTVYNKLYTDNRTLAWPAPVDDSRATGGPSTDYKDVLYTKGIQLYYTKEYDDGSSEEVPIGEVVSNTEENAYSGKLYSLRDATRREALQVALNEFLETVWQNAEAQNVDHRVSLIGYAQNDVPGYWDIQETENRKLLNSSENAYHGTLPYDYVNTGLFVNGNFQNYQEIVGMNALDNDATLYDNAHYYIQYDNAWRAVKKSEADKKWYIVPDQNGTPAEGSVAVTRGTGAGQYVFYEPIYSPLTNRGSNNTNYYQHALHSIRDNSGYVNDDLTNAVKAIGSYGGTYTSFGLTMANQVFKYNPIPEGENRKRIVIVFSDGEPGNENGTFNQGIANEAIAESTVAKSEYGANVYTVYLHAPDATASQDMLDFMSKMSSDYSSTLTEVYSRDESFDTSKTYYFEKAGKTTSATVKHNYADFYIHENGKTGYSIYDGNSYSGTITDKDGNTVSKSNLVLGETYYLSGVDDPVVYDYMWYGSDGKVAMPRTDKYDDSDHYQFFDIDVSQSEDAEGKYYSQETNSANGVISSFVLITKSLDLPASVITLNGENAIMRDIITKEFQLPTKGNEIDKDKIEAWVVDASGFKDDGTPIFEGNRRRFELWATDNNGLEKDRISIKSNKDGSTTIDVFGFDYGAHYSDAATNTYGQKLIVTIDGLKVAEGSFGTLYSNDDKSGIYWNNGINTSRVVDFDKPFDTIDPFNAYVKLWYGGPSSIQGQTFPVEFKLTKSDRRTPYSGQFGGYTFNSKGVYETSMADGNDRFFDNIPPDAILTVTVGDPDKTSDEAPNSAYYTYEMRGLDNKDSPNSFAPVKTMTVNINASDTKGGNPGSNVGAKVTADNFNQTRELEIKISDDRQIINVTNQTEGNYANRELAFPIKLTLKNGHENVTGTFTDTTGHAIVFEDGVATVNLAHNQTIGIFVPRGYVLTVKDDEGKPDGYSTSFLPGDGEVSIDDDVPSATAVASLTDPQIEDGNTTSVTIIHTIDDIPPTGINDSEHFTGPWIWIGAGVATIAAGALYVIYRKRRFA